MQPLHRPGDPLELLAAEVAPLGARCYAVARAGAGPDGGAKPCVVIDPGGEGDRVADALEQRGWAPELVFYTHAHYDHIGGAAELLMRFPQAAVAASEETSRRAADPRGNLSFLILPEAVRAPEAGQLLAPDEEFTAAGILWTPYEVPGHEPGELVYHVPEAGWLFSGDTVFAGSIGRSDFPGGDGAALVGALLHLLRRLPPATRIFPGHGPDTAVGEELASNPFLAR